MTQNATCDFVNYAGRGMDIFRARLKIAIDEACKERKMSQEKLAESMGMDRTTLRNYFTRAQKMPMDKLRIIVDELSLDANWLLGRDVSPEWPKNDPLRAISDKLDRVLNEKDN